jgi:hypothetical protein
MDAVMSPAERTETAKITILPMGSSIPDWLIVADPKVAGAPKGHWRFDVDVSIVELADDFIVFPILTIGEPSTARILDMTGIGPHHIYAATKPVRIVHAFNSFFGLEYAEAVDAKNREMAERAQANVVATVRTDTHTAPLPVPPKGFWQHFRAAWWSLIYGIG